MLKTSIQCNLIGKHVIITWISLTHNTGLQKVLCCQGLIFPGSSVQLNAMFLEHAHTYEHPFWYKLIIFLIMFVQNLVPVTVDSHANTLSSQTLYSAGEKWQCTVYPDLQDLIIMIRIWTST